MVRVNLDTKRLDPEESRRRKMFTAMEPDTSIPEDGILHVSYTNGVRFKLKKPKFDPKGAIDGFFAEEDMRRDFFYPHLPCNFIDVGVAHGSWTIPALAVGSKVLGFEIDPRYHDSLRGTLSVNNNFSGDMSLYSLGLYNTYGRGNVNELEDVTFGPLDAFMKFHPFAPEYIKIDVEGMEERVLDGARKTIDLFHPKLFVEVHYWEDITYDVKEEVDNKIIDLLKPYEYSYKRGRVEKAFTYFFFT